MAMNLSRRFFLAGISALTFSRSAGAAPQQLPHPFAAAINNSIEISRKSLDDRIVYAFWDAVEDTNPKTIDTSGLKSQLIEKIKAVESSLTRLLYNSSHSDIVDALLEAERTKYAMEVQADALQQEVKINSMLQSVGLDLETWNEWCDEFIADDRSGLDFSGGIIRYNTGGLSRYFMDSMDFYQKEKPAEDAVKSLCVDIHEIYPVNGSLANCSVLEKIVKDQSGDPFVESLKRRLLPWQSGLTLSSQPKELEPFRYNDLLPFQYDHFGGLIGNDYY